MAIIRGALRFGPSGAGHLRAAIGVSTPARALQLRPGHGASCVLGAVRRCSGAADRPPLSAEQVGLKRPAGAAAKPTGEKVTAPAQDTEKLLEEARAERQKAIDQLKNAEADAETSRQEVATLKQAQARYEEQSKALTGSTGELERKLKTAEAETTKLKTELKAASDAAKKAEQLQKTLDEKSAELQAASDAAKAAEAQAQQSCQADQKELQKALADKEQLQKTLDKKSAELQAALEAAQASGSNAPPRGTRAQNLYAFGVLVVSCNILYIATLNIF